MDGLVEGCAQFPDSFVRRYARSLFATALVLCGDPYEAEELVQSTLVALLPKWHAVSAANNPLAYVRRSLVHRFIDLRRGARRVVILDVDAFDRADPVDVAADAATRDVVRHLLADLPDRQRAAVVLRYLYDWSDGDIAEAIGCRRATVRSLTRRAMLAMREALVEDTASPPDQGTQNHAGASRHPEYRHEH